MIRLNENPYNDINEEEPQISSSFNTDEDFQESSASS